MFPEYSVTYVPGCSAVRRYHTLTPVPLLFENACTTRPFADHDIVARLQRSLVSMGQRFVLGARVATTERLEDSVRLTLHSGEVVEAERALFAAGRQSNVGDLGLERRVPLIAPSFHAAMFMLPDSDLILPVPKETLLSVSRLGLHLRSFVLPIPLPTLVLTQAWHPRYDKDPAHKWFRETLRASCNETWRAAQP